MPKTILTIKQFTLLAFFTLMVGISPKALSDKQAESSQLDKIQKKITGLLTSIQQIGNKKQTLEEELEITEKHYGAISQQIKQLQTQSQQIQQEQAEIKQKLSQQQQQLNAQISGLQQQIRTAYAIGQTEKLKLLLNQQNPAVSSRVMSYYDYFNKARLQQLQEVDNIISSLQALQLQNQKKSDELKQLTAQKKLESQQLQSTKVQRAQLLKKLSKQYNSKEQQLRRLQDNENRLKKLIASIEQKPIPEKKPLQKQPASQAFAKGKPWPVKGKVIKKFGSPRAESRWDGVLIRAQEGTDIRVVKSGKVIFANWLRGYGLMMIVKHSHNYMTVYAFNQHLYKKVGDTVNTGDIIAAVGNSGGRPEAGLYFGVRKGRQAIDPIKWCKKLANG